MQEFDAIIAGASFAGLTLADHLEGNILLIDRREIGTHQTSACATFIPVLEELGCRNSILQEFDHLVLHIPEERNVELVEPLCTFDYGKFCKTIANRIKAKILITPVNGASGKTVHTYSGDFRSDCIIDCTGWRAVLGSSIDTNYVDRNNLAFAIESVMDYTDESLHLFVDKNIINKGAAWIFPIGNKSRIGVSSYAGKTHLLPELSGFIKSMGYEGGDVHGGYIPYGLREPVVENIFMLGDSGGQVVPATEEGIRPSMIIGRECARIVQDVIDGNKPLNAGLSEYTDIVNKKKRGYNMMMNLQNILAKNMVPETIRKVACNRIFAKMFQRMYLGI
jgi:flavin-dependent dehydrogenase